MDIKSLKHATEYAKLYGVKALVYGPPGSGKTPIINTAPRPVLLACEPGLLSMRGSTVPTFQAFTAKSIDEFFEWLFSSNETKNFDTVCIDSTTQMAEIYLNDFLNGTSKGGNKIHGMAAYGEMAKATLKHLERLYFLPYKHTYLIAKESVDNENGLTVKRPYYPGQQLPKDVPGKYDCILRLAIHNVPGVGQVKAFRCIASLEEMARNRTGTLNEFEPPDFSDLVNKCMV